MHTHTLDCNAQMAQWQNWQCMTFEPLSPCWKRSYDVRISLSQPAVDEGSERGGRGRSSLNPHDIWILHVPRYINTK